MLKLYTFPTCPYCQKVRRAFSEDGIPYEEVNAEPGTPGAEELQHLGGKLQVPFLLDTEAGLSMYESDDIITYARKNLKKN